ncbi:hypothetical protein HDV64DRAFT_97670 [Trichoderma sp. TUCIM 5745]
MENCTIEKSTLGPHRALCFLASAPNFVSPLPIQPISSPLILSLLDGWESGIRFDYGHCKRGGKRGLYRRTATEYRYPSKVHVSSLWTGLVHRRVDRHSLWPSLYGRGEMSLTGPDPLDSSSAEPVRRMRNTRGEPQEPGQRRTKARAGR